MSCYRVLALLALICLICLASCGGGPKGFSLVAKPGITPEQSPYVTTVGVSGLKPQLHFTYGLEGHPNAGGFTVVALENEYTPKPATDLPYSITIQQGDNPTTPSAVLSASGQRTVLAHFRYDPTKWEIGGVGSSNCWPGASDFLPVVAIVEPGVLLICNTPLRASPASHAQGVFATIQMQPVGKNTSYLYNSGDTQLHVIWERSGLLSITHRSDGTINFRLDGAFGDAASKDGDLTGDELTDEHNNNQLHSIECDRFGETYNTGGDWTDLSWSFREAFIPDYDNDGIVDVGDISPVGQFWNGAIGTYAYWYQGQRGVHEVGQPLAWLNLKAKYYDYDQNFTPDRSLWYWNDHDINAFWYQDHLEWPDLKDPHGIDRLNQPWSYEKYIGSLQPTRPHTETANAVDGNWDGLVYDYYNWNTGGPAVSLESKYDEPGNDKYHPGDLALIDKHWGEQLTGYQVFIQGYNAANPAPATFLPDSLGPNAVLARNYYRVNDPENPPAVPNLIPLPIAYNSNVGQQVPGKATVPLILDQFAFPNMNDSQDWNYDIYIYPYYYNAGTVSRGPVTILNDAYKYHYVNIPDNEGPVFVNPTGPATRYLPPHQSGDPEHNCFFRTAYSWKNKVVVYFSPAIDKPLYYGYTDVKYRCYYSIDSQFNRNQITGADVHQLAEVKEFNYNEHYTSYDGHPLFNYSNLYFVIDHDGNNDPLADGQVVHFMVVAEDQTGHKSYDANEVSESKSTLPVNPNDDALVLASGTRSDIASIVGAIQADANNVYITYASGIQPGSGDQRYGILSYRRFRGGDANDLPDDNITSNDLTYKPVIDGSPGRTKLGLTHQSNSTGSQIHDQSEREIPAISWTGWYTDATHQSVSISQRGSNPVWHNVRVYGPTTGQPAIEFNPAALHSFVYTNGSSTARIYLSAWENRPMFSSIRGLQLSTSNDLEDYETEVWSAPIDLLLPGSSQTQSSAADLVFRSSFGSLEWSQSMPQPLAVPRTCYLLESGDQDSGNPPPDWLDQINLCRSIDGTIWSIQSIRDSMPDCSADSSMGPNSLGVTVHPTGHYVYTAYVNSICDEEQPAIDTLGLRVACANDTGSGPASWDSPQSGGMIDTYYAEKSDHRYDQVDLGVKPDSLISNAIFDSLGCAYIDQNARVIKLAETLGAGSNAMWVVQPYGGGGLGVNNSEQNGGQLLWLKLAYFKTTDGEQIPYILFARRMTRESGFDICLWRPGGF
jgi:hypothetical protein